LRQVSGDAKHETPGRTPASSTTASPADARVVVIDAAPKPALLLTDITDGRFTNRI